MLVTVLILTHLACLVVGKVWGGKAVTVIDNEKKSIEAEYNEYKAKMLRELQAARDNAAKKIAGRN